MADVMLGEKQMKVVIDLREHEAWDPENPTWQHPDGAYKTHPTMQELVEKGLAYYEDGVFKPVSVDQAPDIKIRKTSNGGKRITRGAKVKAKKTIRQTDPTAGFIAYLQKRIDEHYLIAQELEKMLKEFKA